MLCLITGFAWHSVRLLQLVLLKKACRKQVIRLFMRIEKIKLNNSFPSKKALTFSQFCTQG